MLVCSLQSRALSWQSGIDHRIIHDAYSVNKSYKTLMISPSRRTANFHYAIRNLVSAAEAQERQGRRVIYLNIGDPQAYGFRPPAHVVEAVTRALRDGFTGYSHSSGLWDARLAVAAHATALGAPTDPQQV